MGRPKKTDEEKKLTIQNKNKRYYNRHKEDWSQYNGSASSVIYILKGFDENKVFVGSTHNIKTRQKQLEKEYGEDKKFEIVLDFNNPLVSLNVLKMFENIIITGLIGANNCINVRNNELQAKKLSSEWKIVYDYIASLNENQQKLVLSAIDRIKLLAPSGAE